MRNINWW